MTLDFASASRPCPSTRPSKRTFARAAAFWLALTSLLIGCGGGGGDAESAVPANRAPSSHAGAAQNVPSGTEVTLDGSASVDPDSDSLSYRWSFASRPNGSVAALSGASTATPRFTADMPGTYVATLVVNDGLLDSTAATVSIVAALGNVAPVAHAGSAQTQPLRTTVTLDGLLSSDANGDALRYEWTLTTVPSGSTAALNSRTAARPSFVADRVGEYKATLTVSDGTLSSPTPATVTIKVVPVFGYAMVNFTGGQSTRQGMVGFSLNGFDGGWTSSSIQAVRLGRGSYAVDFKALGGSRGHYTVLVTNIALSGTYRHCAANGSEVTATRTLRAYVLCANAGGAPEDGMFSVVVLGEQSLAPDKPFVIGSARADGSLRDNYAASGGEMPTNNYLQQSGGGVNLYEFDTLPTTPAYYTAFVSAAQSAHVICSRPDAGNLRRRVWTACRDASGNYTPADLNFALVSGGREGRRYTMLEADQEERVGTYTPSRVATTSATPPTVTRESQGVYVVMLPGVGMGVTTRGLMVTGSLPAMACHITEASFEPVNPFSLVLRVACHSFFGGAFSPIDARFSVMALE